MVRALARQHRVFVIGVAAIGIGVAIACGSPYGTGEDGSIRETPVDSGADTGATTAVDAGADADATAVDANVGPEECDPTMTEANVNCGSQNLPTCARNANAFPTYPRERGEDLVECKDNDDEKLCVRRCTTACISSPSGFADLCDRCAGRADGFYCANEFLGGTDGDLAVECKAGKVASVAACGLDRCRSKCPREPTTALPACCVATP